MYLRRIALASARRHASLSNVGQAGFRTPASSALKMPVASMSTRKSWIPESEEALQKVTTNAMIHEVAEQQKERASRIVPWFLKSMPSAYFKQISIDMQSQHVQAIASLKELTNSDLSLRMEADTPETNTHHVTFITSGTQSGLLHSQIKKLVVPAGQSLSNVNVFSSLDDSLALNVFSFQGKGAKSSTTRADAARIFDYLAEVQAGTHVGNANVPVYSEADFGAATMDDYLTRIQPSYARQSNARRFLIQKNLYEQVRGSEGARVHLEQYMPDAGGPSSRSWVTIAAANVLPEVLLRLCSALISSRGLDITRCHLDSVDDSTASGPASVTMLRLLVTSTKDGRSLNTDSDFAHTLSRDLQRCKWLDASTTELGLKCGLDRAEVITAFCSMLHGPLNHANPQAFASIASTIEVLNSHANYIAIAESIAALFLERFDPHNTPGLSEAAFEERCGAISERTQMLQNHVAVTLLAKMLVGVKGVLRTNYYNNDRYALSMRIYPKVMATGKMGECPSRPMPFGTFFVHGRHFNAFHSRFRDIARGGLRIVTPSNSDQYALESSRQFDEVYNLSHAQQLKNKDIPEGGAKGVILVNTPSIDKAAHAFAMRKAVKAFTDAMLDLIVLSSTSKLVDFYHKDELIYFGPDEQIVPSDIEWIIDRAAVRGYPLPDAFMSSKKDNGINHKEYGVTSEGIVVYLDVALRRCLGINPHTDPFTIKVTGGPDGDVAGNLIRILHREYGSNCRVVGIADGFGVAEDPAGLDTQELLRLVNESLPITEFDRSKLSSTGVSLSVTTDEGLARRNSMHFRVKADAFLPAGGRPNTINNDNWQNFLDKEGQPSSKLIVEGANIFITPEARFNLFDKARVAIVKDSSANKCGVITSSCEVAASMLLSKAEFMANKAEIVEDVLVQLRKLARLEGELLFKEYNNYPGALPSFSERISQAIATVTDAVTDALESVPPEDPLFQELMPLIYDSLPKKLVQVGGDRIPTNFPVQYQRNAIASALASKLVYKEGIHLVETQPRQVLAERAFQYYRKDVQIQALLRGLRGEQAHEVAEKNKDFIINVLEKGGARAGLDIF